MPFATASCAAGKGYADTLVNVTIAGDDLAHAALKCCEDPEFPAVNATCSDTDGTGSGTAGFDCAAADATLVARPSARAALLNTSFTMAAVRATCCMAMPSFAVSVEPGPLLVTDYVPGV